MSWRAAAVAICSVAATAADAHGRSGDPEVVIEWNEILEGVLPAGGLAPPRYYAMLHIAMFDAINSIERERTGPIEPVSGRRGARPRKSQRLRRPAMCSWRSSRPLKQRLTPRCRHEWRAVGERQAQSAIQVGKAVAAAILAWRQNDGWTAGAAGICAAGVPGPVPAHSAGLRTAGVRQFAAYAAVCTADQHAVPAGRAAGTDERAIRCRISRRSRALVLRRARVRTAEQTQLAQLFASVTSRTVHWALWNHVARDTARSNGLSLIETARLFALLNVSIHDGLQTSHTGKFIYGVWRPVTAIRRADEDMNPLTIARSIVDAAAHTPTYPSHAGNMACVGASAARALALVHGTDDVAVHGGMAGEHGQPGCIRSHTRGSRSLPKTRRTAASTAAFTSGTRVSRASRLVRRWRSM